MSFLSVGDLTQSFLLRHQSTRLKTEMQRLTSELASGKLGDLAKAVSGDFGPLGGIERSLSNLKAFKVSANEASRFVSATQDSLGLVQSLSQELAPGLMTAGNSGHSSLISAAATDSRQKFRAAVSALNTRVGDRNLFSGTATDRPPLAPADTILADLQVAISGQTTAAGVRAAVDTWFNTPGGGYDTVAYLGSASSLSPFQIGAGQEARMDVTASDQAFRDTLKGFALSALVADGALSGNVGEQADLLRSAGEQLLTSQRGMADVRANVGSVQGHIEDVMTENSSETASLKIARSKITSADPYEAASSLKLTQTNLEMLYTLTARVSSLNLVNFLR